MAATLALGRAARSGPGVPGSGLGGPGGRRGGAGRSSLKNWRVRSRLLLLIAIPTVTALVLGGVRIGSATQSALAFQRAEERAVLAADVTQLAQRLETERDQTIYFIALGSSGRPGYLVPPPVSKRALAIKQYNSVRAPAIQQYGVIKAFYRQTDQAVAHFHALVAHYHNAYGSAAEQRVSSAVAGLGGLPYLRYASTRTQLYPLVVVRKYADLINNLLVIDDQTAQGTGDPVLSQTVAVLGLASRMKEEASEQRAILAAALLQGNLTQLEVSALDTAQANQASGLQAFDLSATASQREQWDNNVSGSFIYLAPSQEQQAETLQATKHSLGGDTTNAAGFYDAMTSGHRPYGLGGAVAGSGRHQPGQRAAQLGREERHSRRDRGPPPVRPRAGAHHDGRAVDGAAAAAVGVLGRWKWPESGCRRRSAG